MVAEAIVTNHFDFCQGLFFLLPSPEIPLRDPVAGLVGTNVTTVCPFWAAGNAGVAKNCAAEILLLVWIHANTGCIRWRNNHNQ
jgi:hypothetical protein